MSFCDKSHLILQNTTLLVMLELEYPLQADCFMAPRQVNQRP
jgi:hypothetical protein